MDIVMPSLGADMDDGKLIEWLVKVGDSVNKGDIIAVIETNKGAIDMEAYHSGTISQLCVQPISLVPVGDIIAKMDVITTDSVGQKQGNKLPFPINANSSYPSQHIENKEFNVDDVDSTFINKGTRLVASPIARKRAAQQHIELSSLQGSGPQGAVLLKDLETYQSTVTHQKTDQQITGMRRSIALAMEKSKREIPHYYLSLDIDITEAQQYLDTINSEREPEQRILLLALMLRAIAHALVKFPQFNGFYRNERYEPSKPINIANAIALRTGGLVVPAILNAESKSVEDLMAALSDLTIRSRTGHLRSSELSDASITVSNIGDRGADLLLGIIYPPQVAIIGLGKAQQKMVIVNDEPLVRRVITVTLSADHRVSDGISGAKFLNTINQQLQQPGKL